MNKLMDQLAKKRQTRVKQTQGSYHPSTTKLEIPIELEKLLDIDEEMINLIFAYKQKIKKVQDDKWEDKLSEMKSESGPSAEARELVSFVYDRMDQFEKVLSEEEFDELESLMMNVK